VQPFRRVDQKIFEIGELPLGFRKSHHHTEMFFSLPDFRCGFSCQSGFDDILDVRNIQPIARRPIAVDFKINACGTDPSRSIAAVTTRELPKPRENFLRLGFNIVRSGPNI